MELESATAEEHRCLEVLTIAVAASGPLDPFNEAIRAPPL